MRSTTLAALLAVAAAGAQAQAYIPWSDTAKGATLRATLETFERVGASSPGITQALRENRERLAIVFVPGILGSSLRARDGKLIYGDLSAPSTLVSRLLLPAELVDETAESGIKAELLESLGPMDLYGDAVQPMRRWAEKNRVKFLTCGYDWRRDIRSGARDLERCIATGLTPKQTDLIVVAHSMGGLVSWTWAQKQAKREYSDSRKLLLLTTLGSPLGGSCEIVRMIQTGYIQPLRSDTHSLRPELSPLKRVLEGLVDAFSNGVTGVFTQGIRPLVLSWPGAIELSPSPPTFVEKTSCVGIPPSDDKPAGSPATIYYSADFWNSAAGRQMLSQGEGAQPYAVPAYASSVLAKAREFRSSFAAKPLQAPAWVYYSRVWKVPTEAGYKHPYITSANEWGSTFGDGRVPVESALNYPYANAFSHRYGLASVHGNLPEDPNFFDDFFVKNLPRTIAAYWAVDMMDRATRNPAWISAFAKLRPIGAEVNEVQVALEPAGAPDAKSLRVKEALDVTAKFNEALCKSRGGCAKTYDGAKTRIAAVAPEERETTRITEYSAALRQLNATDRNYAFAEGNRGLALASAGSWSAASTSMLRAEASLGSDPSASESLQLAQARFKVVLERNLAKSLIESGQCKAAQPYVRASADSSAYSKAALTKPCSDVASGLLYCFDIEDFCKGSN